jgi:integrase
MLKGLLSIKSKLLTCEGWPGARRAGPRQGQSPALTPGQRRHRRRLDLARDALIQYERCQILGNLPTEWSRERLIFTTAGARPVEPRNLARSFHRVVHAAGLRPIRLHDLRHTTASLLKRLGVDPNDAMVILGHSRIAVTLGIYTHGDEDSRRDSLARLDQLLSQARRRAATGQPDTAVAVTFAVTAPDTKNSGG